MMPALAPSADAGEEAAATPPHLRECRDCGQIQVVPAMPPSARAVCLRCNAVLRHTHHEPLMAPLALHTAALVMLAISAGTMLLSVSSFGMYQAASLFSGPAGLEQHGMWGLALLVLLTTFVIPLLKLLAVSAVLIGLQLPRPPGWLRRLFAWADRLRPWSMIEIYLLGLFVAYSRLGKVVTVDIGPAVYALGALMLTMVAADYALDRQAVWEAMERRGLHRAPPRRTGSEGPPVRLGCDTCGLVSRAEPGSPCPRCASALHHRKPFSIARTWALGLSALILYVPANYYPVLTVIRLGWGQPSTIIGGVEELIAAGLWPLAALVFFASIVVPGLKLIGLGVLLISTQRGSRRRLRDRTRLYRIVDSIGRWSMIDIFMGSILVALLQFGIIARVTPGFGAVAFAAVVVLTMLAAQSFDPRLMWDAAGVQAEYQE
ncbi:MAG TPA: paraquat-inducible protein A [Acetobacteraceae bacterium]|nr:paraquat-inducible protein A [Acetobacteraceae bacterium]